jgi:hypothetical protein
MPTERLRASSGASTLFRAGNGQHKPLTANILVLTLRTPGLAFSDGETFGGGLFEEGADMASGGLGF